MPQVENLKVRTLDAGSKPFTPEQEVGNFEFPLDCMLPFVGRWEWRDCGGAGVEGDIQSGEIVSQTLLPL